MHHAPAFSLLLALAAGSAFPAWGQPAAPAPPAAPANPGVTVQRADPSKPIPEGAIPVKIDVMRPMPWAIPDGAKPISRVERADGLVTEDFVVGDGAEVKTDWPVVIHSKGYFKDGKEFDSTYNAGVPMVAPIRSAVAGLREGIPGMKVGGKRRLTIPAALAYGSKGSQPAEPGQPPIVPPDTDLVFDITLLDVLQISDEVVGSGEEVRPGATVKCHYRGTVKEDGSEFDSSFSRGQPLEFPLRAVIPGWQYGIPGMKVGGKRRLIVPFAMAYGDRGVPGKIPPRADLVFDVELLEVKNLPAATPPAAPAAPAPGH